MSGIEFLDSPVTALDILPPPITVDATAPVPTDVLKHELWLNLNKLVLLVTVAGIYRAYLAAGIATRGALADRRKSGLSAFPTANVLVKWAEPLWLDRDEFLRWCNDKVSDRSKTPSDMSYREEANWIEKHLDEFVSEAERWLAIEHEKPDPEASVVRRLKRRLREIIRISREDIRARDKCHGIIASMRRVG